MSARRGWTATLFVLAMCMASSATAHLMSSGHGTMNVVKNKAYIVISLPVVVFAGTSAADAVKDGVLTTAELKTHDGALRAAIRAGLTVKTGTQAVTFGTILLNLPEGDGHTPGQGSDLVMMIVAPLGPNAQTVSMSSTLWAKDAQALKIKATVTEGRRTTQTEVHDLTAKAPTHVFFTKKTPKTHRHAHSKKTHAHGHSKPHSH